MNAVVINSAARHLAAVTELDQRIAAIVTVGDAITVRDDAKRYEEAAKLLGASVEQVNEYAQRFLQAAWIFGDLVKGIPVGRPSEKLRTDTQFTGTPMQRRYARRFVGAATEYERIPSYVAECNEQGIGASVAGAISWALGARAAQVNEYKVDVLEGQYDVLVIDPPWEMKKIQRDVRPNQTEHQTGLEYPTMREEELAAIELPVADDAHLWCWTTQRYLPTALRLLAAWEFDYVCTFVWHKPGGFQPIGLPQYNCEFALYGRRGNPKFTTTKGLKLCFEAPRGEHSEKPAEFYDMVERCTAGRRIDIYSGGRERSGFTPWGKPHVVAA